MVSVPSAINEKKAPIQSIVKKIFAYQQSQDGVAGLNTQLKPITLPRRLHISTYGGRSPTARSMLATTPRIIMGKFIPRSYNGFIVSGVVEDFQEEQWVTFSVNINAASTPPSTSQIIPVRNVAFHTGQQLDKCELDWKLLM
jgi:hypothetical protein